MKIMLYITGIILGSVLLCKSGAIKEDDFRTIQLISNMEFIIEENGQLHSQKDTMLICYFNDFVICREQYTYVKYNKHSIHGDTVLASLDPNTIDFIEKRHNYLIWKTGAKEGLEYRGDNNEVKRINVDSVEIKKMFKHAQFYNTKNSRFIDMKFINSGMSFQERYANVFKPDASYCDTTCYIFSSQFRDIPYSLSKTADSIKKSKLVSVKYIYKKTPKGIRNMIDMPRREMVFTIAKVDLDKRNEAMKILEKFKSDAGKLNLN